MKRSSRTSALQIWMLALGTVAALVLMFIGAIWWVFRQTYGDPDLVRAAASGNAAKVASLLKRGSPPNSYHIEGSSALWWAVNSGSVECVKLLLDHGADPNSSGQWNTVIEEAVGNLELDWEPVAGRRAIAKELQCHLHRIKDPAQAQKLRDAFKPAPSPKASARSPKKRATHLRRRPHRQAVHVRKRHSGEGTSGYVEPVPSRNLPSQLGRVHQPRIFRILDRHVNASRTCDATG